MNVCMNIIRLATVRDIPSDDDDGANDDGDDDDVGVGGGGPSGQLHRTPPLPLQDRIAIARYACHPSRVADLVGPLCARLTGQFGAAEGLVRALEELDGREYDVGGDDDGSVADKRGGSSSSSTSSSKSAALGRKKGRKHPPQSKQSRSYEGTNGERTRLRAALHDLTANVQDELLLLDDLLRVGLISLNEQAIEMMLATFVYPMLLQPLLLPLRRFASGGSGGGNGNSDGRTGTRGTGACGRRPAIVLQSPEPFSRNRGEQVSTSPQSVSNVDDDSGHEDGEKEEDGSVTASVEEATPKSNSAAPNDDSSNPNTATAKTNPARAKDSSDAATATTHSNANNTMDLAPAKTALYGLSVLFSSISNPTLQHLLLVAFLHPRGPEATGGMVIRSSPKITLPKNTDGGKNKKSTSGDTVFSSDDFRLEVRTEGNQRRLSRETEGFQRVVNVYAFGTDSDEGVDAGAGCGEGGFGSRGGSGGDCIFILAPALVDILRNHTCSKCPPAFPPSNTDDEGEVETKSSKTAPIIATSAATATRPNPYRRVLLRAISGAGEMAALQPLATAALHAAMSSQSDATTMGGASDYGDDDNNDDDDSDDDDSLLSSTKIVRTIMFPPSLKDDADANDPSGTNGDNECAAVARETIHSLCRAIVNTSVTYDGWWKVKYDAVAARTLVDVLDSSEDDCPGSRVQLACDFVREMKAEAAVFLVSLPSHLDGRTRKETPQRSLNGDVMSTGHGDVKNGGAVASSNGEGKGNRQHLDHWLLDRFFFDQAEKFSPSVVENVCYLKERSAAVAIAGDGKDSNDNNDDAPSKERYCFGLDVLSSISVSKTTSLLCGENVDGRRVVVVDNMVVDGAARGNTPFHCAASWALACLYLDALCGKLSKMGGGGDGMASQAGSGPEGEGGMALHKNSHLRKLSHVSAKGDDDVDHCRDARSKEDSLAHISSTLAIAVLDEGDSSSSSAPENSKSASSASASAVPPHGSPVGLVGKAAFPCVCEVSPPFSSLFTGRTCISNEGVRWQSLYLVVSGRWAVLAEPGHGGTGGEGRVVTACRLACLAVKKDGNLANNRTPARRLLLVHASLDPRPPSLFVADGGSSSASTRANCRAGGGGDSGGPNLGRDGLRLTRSRLDLWFEDANAAGHACRVLSAKIAKARARRGVRIRAALLA